MSFENNTAGRTAGRAAGQVTAGRCGLRAKLLLGGEGRGGLRAMMWQNVRCWLTAGQGTAGRGGLRAGDDQYAGRAAG